MTTPAEIAAMVKRHAEKWAVLDRAFWDMAGSETEMTAMLESLGRENARWEEFCGLTGKELEAHYAEVAAIKAENAAQAKTIAAIADERTVVVKGLRADLATSQERVEVMHETLNMAGELLINQRRPTLAQEAQIIAALGGDSGPTRLKQIATLTERVRALTAALESAPKVDERPESGACVNHWYDTTRAEALK